MHLLCVASKCYSDSKDCCIVASMNGYFVNLGGILIFQPTEDTGDVFSTLTSSSFEFGSNIYPNNFDINSLDEVGDSLLVLVHENERDSFYMMLHYFYGEAKFYLNIWDTSYPAKMIRYKKPKYEVVNKSVRYGIDGRWINTILLSIRPKYRKHYEEMVNYYDKNYYVKPLWLKQ